MDIINYKFELFEGPLDLLLSLVEKNKLKIDDIPIDLICEQYMEYIREASLYNIDLACEFLYMASELMLIKSRMLLPRDPEKDEDPRKILIDAILEYQKAKLAATELSDLYMEYGTRMVKETDDISPDRTYVADHSIELLRAALIHVFTETRLNEKTAQKEFDKIVNAPRIPVHTVISNLMADLKKSDVFLDGFLRNSESKSEIIAKFIGILELLKSHIITIDDSAADDETGVTNMISHARITLIATDNEIEVAELDSYQ